jgi:hypothetical protein
MTDPLMCMHQSLIDSLRVEARNEWERAEDYRTSCKTYKRLLDLVLDDARAIRDQALDVLEAVQIADRIIATVNRERRHLP